MHKHQSVSHLILDRASIPSMSDVYLLGCFASNVTFHSQQRRAFNLIWALFEEGRLSSGKKTAVVGGGLAGRDLVKGCVNVSRQRYPLG